MVSVPGYVRCVPVPWSRIARAPRDRPKLRKRHLSNAIERTGGVTPNGTWASALRGPRAEVAPANAFVDLSGFTRLEEERGDERVAPRGARVRRMPKRTRPGPAAGWVKLLGDGALLRLRVGRRRRRSGAGHAGRAAGRRPAARASGDRFRPFVSETRLFAEPSTCLRLSDLADAGQTVDSADIVEG